MQILLALCLMTALLAKPAGALEFTDSAGRRVMLPAKIERVFAAGPPAAVVLAILAPEKLLGWPTRLHAGALDFLGSRLRQLPELGRLTGRGDTANLEVVIAAKPDLIVDFGTVAPTYISLADRVQAQTGIPVVLVDGRFPATAASIRLLGKMLGVEERAEALARYAEETFALVDRVLAEVPPERRPRVYLARGPYGLETGIEGSINTEIIERAGGRNVARREGGRQGLAPVSIELVFAWEPDTIVTLNSDFAALARTDPVWREVRAVRAGRLFVAPDLPWGWIDGPPSINRLIGLRWLVMQFFPERVNLNLKQEVDRFYRLFYGVTLDDAAMTALLAGSGAR